MKISKHARTAPSGGSTEPSRYGNGRLATKRKASEYAGVSPRVFEKLIAQGVLPGPLPGTRHWDLKALDIALDEASGLSAAGSPYDSWKKTRQ